MHGKCDWSYTLILETLRKDLQQELFHKDHCLRHHCINMERSQTHNRVLARSKKTAKNKRDKERDSRTKLKDWRV